MSECLPNKISNQLLQLKRAALQLTERKFYTSYKGPYFNYSHPKWKVRGGKKLSTMTSQLNWHTGTVPWLNLTSTICFPQLYRLDEGFRVTMMPHLATRAQRLHGWCACDAWVEGCGGETARTLTGVRPNFCSRVTTDGQRWGMDGVNSLRPVRGDEGA